tara:strand:+ start:480 stop:674 length:195 start_codon:yes stop_codon:yes gene_type:complete
MSLKINLPNRDYYHLWAKHSAYTKPWERQFLNWDFVNFEKTRIEKASHWESDFYKKNQGFYSLF